MRGHWFFLTIWQTHGIDRCYTQLAWPTYVGGDNGDGGKSGVKLQLSYVVVFLKKCASQSFWDGTPSLMSDLGILE